MTTLTCDSCGKKMTIGQQAWHFECPLCGLERSTLEANINRDNSMDEAAREAALNPIRQHNFHLLLDRLRTCFPPSSPGGRRPRLLDVGCAHGWFIEKAGQYYDVLGLEPDEQVARRAQKRKLPVRTGYFPAALADDEQFDVIVFNDVLEHIPETQTILQECERRLLPGGMILINAPDKGGFFYRTAKILSTLGRSKSFERMWQAGMPSPHLYYFNSLAISNISRHAGLAVCDEMSLPAISTRGLYKRILYAGNVSRVKALLICAGIYLLTPLIRLCPSDISVWMLKRAAA